MNVIVEASTVSVSADGNSKNFLDRVSVAAKHTKLTATNGSLNSISDSSFKGPAGEVRMQGEHTQRGNVTLQDSSVGFSGDSEVQFGGWRMGTRDGNFVIGTVQPAVPLLRCPICQAQFPRPANAIAFTGCQCPKCGARSMLPYQPR
jgi:DNA-directed RNA polymerase subunit RPC12/RpoP